MVKTDLLTHLAIQGGKLHSETWEQLAKKFGFKSGEAARSYWKKHKEKAPKYYVGFDPYLAKFPDNLLKINESPSTNHIVFDEDVKGQKATLEYKGPKEIKTLEDLVRECDIDLDKWEITRMINNSWGKEGNQNYQVKVWLEPKKEKESEIIQNLLNNYKSSYQPISTKDIILADQYAKPCMVEMSLVDFHLDKKTLNNKTIEERESEFFKVLDNLLFRAYRSHYIENIVFVIGNDYFHTDNYQGNTTNGTPQDISVTWSEAYEKGFDIMVKAIAKLKQLCEHLTVVLVQGNHDKTKSYYLAHALEVYFKPDPNINFDRQNERRKALVYGSTFIGYHHGNSVKLDELPLTFATEYGPSFGNAKYREIHTGDKHYYMEKEVKGVRIKQLPSLSDTDRWHDENNYINNIKAGVAIVYDKELGRVAEFEERI